MQGGILQRYGVTARSCAALSSFKVCAARCRAALSLSLTRYAANYAFQFFVSLVLVTQLVA